MPSLERMGHLMISCCQTKQLVVRCCLMMNMSVCRLPRFSKLDVFKLFDDLNSWDWLLVDSRGWYYEKCYGTKRCVYEQDYLTTTSFLPTGYLISRYRPWRLFWLGFREKSFKNPKKSCKKKLYGSADVLTVFLSYLKTYFHRQGGNLGIPYAI